MKKSYKCVTLNHIELRTMKLNTFFMHDFSYEAALSIVACCVLLCKRIDLSLHQGRRKTIFSQSIIREIDLRGGNAANKFQQSSREIKSKIKKSLPTDIAVDCQKVLVTYIFQSLLVS